MHPINPKFYTNSPLIRLTVRMVEQLHAAVSRDAKGCVAIRNNDFQCLEEGKRPKGTPSGPFGEGGRDEPAGEDIERFRGGSVRLRNLAAVQRVCIHPLLSKPCANSVRIHRCAKIAIGPRAKISLSNCFI